MDFWVHYLQVVLLHRSGQQASDPTGARPNQSRIVRIRADDVTQVRHQKTETLVAHSLLSLLYTCVFSCICTYGLRVNIRRHQNLQHTQKGNVDRSDRLQFPPTTSLRHRIQRARICVRLRVHECILRLLLPQSSYHSQKAVFVGQKCIRKQPHQLRVDPANPPDSDCLRDSVPDVLDAVLGALLAALHVPDRLQLDGGRLHLHPPAALRVLHRLPGHPHRHQQGHTKCALDHHEQSAEEVAHYQGGRLSDDQCPTGLRANVAGTSLEHLRSIESGRRGTDFSDSPLI